jgi:hypothetical protein
VVILGKSSLVTRIIIVSFVYISMSALDCSCLVSVFMATLVVGVRCDGKYRVCSYQGNCGNIGVHQGNVVFIDVRTIMVTSGYMKVMWCLLILG